MTTVSFHLDDELNNKLLKIAEISERSKSYIIRKAVEYFIASYRIPNAETRMVIDEARNGQNLTKIDDFAGFLKTL